MAIISVRVSSDIPVQSEYLPMISLYFLLSTFFTFISFNWFVAANYLKSTKNLPKWLGKCATRIKFLTRSRQLINSNLNPEIVEPTSNAVKRKEIEELVSLLNNLCFTIVFLTMFISFLTIWTIITN